MGAMARSQSVIPIAKTPIRRMNEKMTMKFRYKGRSFGSAQSLGAALKREMAQTVDRALRSAASSSGARIRKTGQGYEIEGTPNQLVRFNRRLR